MALFLENDMSCQPQEQVSTRNEILILETYLPLRTLFGFVASTFGLIMRVDGLSRSMGKTEAVSKKYCLGFAEVLLVCEKEEIRRLTTSFKTGH